LSKISKQHLILPQTTIHGFPEIDSKPACITEWFREPDGQFRADAGQPEALKFSS